MSTDVTDPKPVSPPGTILGFSVGRIVALLSPYVATASGLAATWLFVHFPGLHIFGSEAQAVRLITEAAVFLLTAGITYAIHHKWLDGLSKWERGVVSDLPGDNSVVMPIMPEIPDGDLDDSTGMTDDPDAGEEGKSMPLGWDPDKAKE